MKLYKLNKNTWELSKTILTWIIIFKRQTLLETKLSILIKKLEKGDCEKAAGSKMFYNII